MSKKHHVEHQRQNAHKECLVCLKKKKIIPFLLFIQNHTFVVMFFFMFIKTIVLPPWILVLYFHDRKDIWGEFTT